MTLKEKNGGDDPDIVARSPGFEQSLSEGVADLIWEIWRGSRAIAQRSGVDRPTPEQLFVLRYISDNGSRPIKDIASHLGTTASPATIVVKRMERMGFVRRERRGGDERVVWVSLTPKGQEILAQWRRVRRKALSNLLASLSHDEQATLYALLGKVAASLRATTSGASTNSNTG